MGNNASLIEMEPVFGVENNENNNDILLLKKRLLAICQYVFKLSIIEDPYDPSAHITSENLQIRYLMGCARLTIMNPSYYKHFGALIISFYHRPNINNNNDNDSKSKHVMIRRNEIIKKIVSKLHEANHSKFEEMLFEGMKLIMNDESF